MPKVFNKPGLGHPKDMLGKKCAGPELGFRPVETKIKGPTDKQARSQF